MIPARIFRHSNLALARLLCEHSCVCVWEGGVCTCVQLNVTVNKHSCVAVSKDI